MRKFPLPRVVCAVAFAIAAGAASAQFSNFVSFGDSLSDAGSFKPVLPPGTGLFTTNPGPVWTQALAQRYGLTSSPANQGGRLRCSIFAHTSARGAESRSQPPRIRTSGV